MATEAIDWTPPEPTTTDANDGTQCYNMGALFDVAEESECPGIEWRVPDTLATPAGAEATHGISLWEDVSGALLAREPITPTPGAKQAFLFTTPVTLLPGVDYIAGVYTNHYVYSAGSPAGDASPSGVVTIKGGRLTSYNGGANTAPRPGDVANLTFYVGPLRTTSEDPEEHTTSGTAPATALASGVTGTVRSSAATATGAASAAGTSTTSRTSSGTAPVSATASASVATTRTTTGSAAATARGSATSATTRTTTGSARATAGAGSYIAAGAPGPWLTTRGRSRPLVTRGRRA